MYISCIYIYIYRFYKYLCKHIYIIYTPTLDEFCILLTYFTQPPVSLSEAAAKKLNLPSFKSKKRPGASGPRMAQLLSCHDQRVRISMGGWCFAVVAPVAPVGFTIFPPNNLALKGDLTYVYIVHAYIAKKHFLGK